MLEVTAFERPSDYAEHFKQRYGPTIAAQANARAEGARGRVRGGPGQLLRGVEPRQRRRRPLRDGVPARGRAEAIVSARGVALRRGDRRRPLRRLAACDPSGRARAGRCCSSTANRRRRTRLDPLRLPQHACPAAGAGRPGADRSEAPPQPTPLRGARARQEVTGPFTPVGGFDRMCGITRPVLDQALLDVAIDAGAETRFGERVTGLLGDRQRRGPGPRRDAGGRRADRGALGAGSGRPRLHRGRACSGCRSSARWRRHRDHVRVLARHAQERPVQGRGDRGGAR